MNVHIAIEGVVGRAIQQVLSLTGEHSYTDFDHAKLVLVGGKEDLLRLHRSGKYFVVFCPRDPGALPPNAEWQKIPEMVPLMALVSNEAAIDQKLGIQAVSSVEEVPVERVGLGGLKILVIDDTEQNRERAKQLLKENTLTVASSYGQAVVLLSNESFDVVLTDLYLPMSRHHGALSVDAIEIGKTVPYGLLIALEAARHGADTAIVTDANHHKDCFSAAFDAMRAPYVVGGKKLFLVNYCGKDWAKALELLLK